jgi:hypothetical protein
VLTQLTGARDAGLARIVTFVLLKLIGFFLPCGCVKRTNGSARRLAARQSLQ